MITFSDNEQISKEIYNIRCSIIKQLMPTSILFLENFEELFRCQISGSNIPTLEDYCQAVNILRKRIKASLITNPKNNFSFHDISKIFGETCIELYEQYPYSQLENKNLKDISKDLTDSNGNNVRQMLLNSINLSEEDLQTTFTLPPIKRITFPHRYIIDTQTIRRNIILIYRKSHPNSRIYREDIDELFFSTHNSYFNSETRQLSYRNTEQKELMKNTILQFIKEKPDMTYQTIGDIFGRKREEIRDIARCNGFYRHGNGKSRHEDTQEGIQKNEKKKTSILIEKD